MVFNTRATLAFVARRGEQQSQGSGSLPARVSPGNSHVKCSGQQPQRRYGRVLAMTGMKASGDGVVTASHHVCAPTPVSNPAMPRVVQGLEEASQRPHETAWVEMNKDNSDSGAFTHSPPQTKSIRSPSPVPKTTESTQKASPGCYEKRVATSHTTEQSPVPYLGPLWHPLSSDMCGGLQRQQLLHFS